MSAHDAAETPREPDRDAGDDAEHDTGLRPEDVDPERPRPMDTPWGSFAIWVVGGELVAWESFCPHLLGPLFQGSRAEDAVTCPWHAWRFSLRTGERVDGLADGDRACRLARCAVRVGPRGTLVLAPPR